MNALRARKWALFIFAGFVSGMVAVVSVRNREVIWNVARSAPALTKSALSDALGEAGAFIEFPGEVDLPINGKNTRAVVQYAFDPALQEAMEAQFRQYRPDYGAFVAVDAQTGRVLSMVSYIQNPKNNRENLALRATFPSASVFKVVTAAAAIAERDFSANTVIPFNGRNHTLYRSNILKGTNHNRWTRYMTLKEAFAKSVNTVFAKVGALSVGPAEMKVYADRFGFNRKISADMPLQEGRAPIHDDPWALAETASGYTRDNTMSPLHGALIAAAIVNDGMMMEPYVVQSVHTLDGTPVYSAQPHLATLSVDAKTAGVIRSLMRETVSRGTGHKSFRGFFRGPLADLDVGGKTGSLTGLDPKGKYDWFVGYADSGSRKIAIAALTIHEKLWRVKSSALARKAIETYFSGHNRRDIVTVQNSKRRKGRVPAAARTLAVVHDQEPKPYAPDADGEESEQDDTAAAGEAARGEATVVQAAGIFRAPAPYTRAE